MGFATTAGARTAELTAPPAAGAAAAAPAASSEPARLPPHLTPLTAQQLKDYSSRGVVVVPPEHQGGSIDHAMIWQKMNELHGAGLMPAIGYYDHFPELAAVVSARAAPGLDATISAILGAEWAVQPFIHSVSPRAWRLALSHLSHARSRVYSCEGAVAAQMFAKNGEGGEQGWHADDNGAYNARKMRHHRHVQAEILYYPQATTLSNGPTNVIPYSSYWTTNHESSEGNFSGPDHLDFFEPAARDPEERVAQLERSVAKLQWPLIKSHAVQVPAGSFVLISHNIYHRASRKLDSIDNPDAPPRFMWRMYCYRTTEPPQAPADCTLDAFDEAWRETKHDELTDTALGDAIPTEAIEAWNANLAHAAGVPLPPPPVPPVVPELVQKLRAVGEQAEPQRVGAAYALARAGELGPLQDGLSSERENIRRASAYGLASLRGGLAAAAVPRLLELCSSAAKSTRKYVTFVLGEMAPLSAEVVGKLCHCLLNDESAYVRHCAAGALGCAGIRAFAQEQQQQQQQQSAGESQLNHLREGIDAIVRSLEVEENRIDVSIRQGLGLKQCAPDDLCDMCEGSTWHVGGGYELEPRLEPVRSAVRENVLWACVQLSTHALQREHGALSLVQALHEVCMSDTNVCSIGFAMDALHRLQLRSAVAAEAKAALDSAHSVLTVRCPETLARTQPPGFSLASPELWTQLEQPPSLAAA